MSLVNCIDCAKPVSTKAIACPHCGCPIRDSDASLSEVIKPPNLPRNLDIGSAVFDWHGEGSIISETLRSEVQLDNWPDGCVYINRYENGLIINIMGVEVKTLLVHYSQISFVGFFENIKVEKKGKSVIGRAVIGTILLGPLGGIVGGISGTGTTDTDKSTFEASIKFWSIESKKYKILNVDFNKRKAVGFFEKLKKSISIFSHLHK